MTGPNESRSHAKGTLLATDTRGRLAMGNAGTQQRVTKRRPTSVGNSSKATGQEVFEPAEWRSLAAALGLSPRECGVVRSVFDGASEKRIAEELGLSPHTVHTYLWRIYRKLQVHGREELLVQVFAEFRSLTMKGTAGRLDDTVQ